MGIQFTVYYSQFESSVRKMCGLFECMNLESIIDENADKINSSGKGIIHINKENLDGTCKYLIDVSMPILGTEDLLKIAGGLSPNDDIPVVNVVNFASINWTNFQNPVQYVIVREILKTYVLNNCQIPQPMADMAIHLFYEHLPDKFKENNPPENLNVRFRIDLSDSRYSAVFSFNNMALIILHLDHDGKFITKSYYVARAGDIDGMKMLQKDIPLIPIDLKCMMAHTTTKEITLFDAVYNKEELLKKYPDGSVCHGLCIISIDTGEYWCWDILIKTWRSIGVIAKITDKEDN